MPNTSSQTALKAAKALNLLSSQDRRDSSMRFFKTGPGQYGSHDVFIGVSTPDIRKVVLSFQEMSLVEIKKLLTSKIHEERLLALLIVVAQYKHFSKKEVVSEQQKRINFYLKHLKHVNNWDLVDSSAHQLLGAHLYVQKLGSKLLEELAVSSVMWDRRVAIVSTYHFIRNGNLKPCLKIARMLLSDKEDLMHKACGWMLREVGKQDLDVLRAFIDKHITAMPRTMLRYAIEKMSDKERKLYLSL